MTKRPIVAAFLALVICIVLKGIIWGNIPEQIAVLNAEFGDSLKLEGEISGTVYKITAGENGDCLWIKNACVETDKIINVGKVLLYSDTEDAVKTGNTVRAHGTIYKLETASNEGGFDAFKYYYYTYRVCATAYAAEINVTDDQVNIIKDRLYGLRRKLTDVTQKIYEKNDAAIVTAMIYGDKSELDEDIKELYSSNGIAHILAISGLHVSILGGIIYFILFKISSSLKLSTVLTAIAIFSYGIMTGFSVSTVRAVVMMIIMLLGKMLGRTYDLLNSLGLSGIVILMINPYQIYSIGFLLSFLAVAAIGILYPAVCTILEYRQNDADYMEMQRSMGNWHAVRRIYPFICFIGRKIENLLIVSLCISMVTMPVILYTYYQIQILSVLLNIIVIPLMSVVVGMALFSGIVGMFSIKAAVFLGGCVHYCLKLFTWLCEFVSDMGAGVFLAGRPGILTIIIYYLAITCFTAALLHLQNKCNLSKYDGKKYNLKRNLGRCVYALPVLAVLIFYPEADGKLHIDMLDVGQGDGICIRLPGNEVILVDGGSSSRENIGKDVIVPFLKYHGIDTIDYVFLSHLDDDHISGVREIIENDMYDIKNLFLPDINNSDDEYKTMAALAESRGISVQYLKQGDECLIGNVAIKVLYPYADVAYDDRNGYSQVFILRYQQFSMLFTGDIGREQEMEILEYVRDNGIDIDVDLLKCAHHGSNYSGSIEFLREADALYSLISAGRDNIYGHPGSQLLARLAECKTNYLVTYDTGQISITSDERGYSIKTIKNMETIYEQN